MTDEEKLDSELEAELFPDTDNTLCLVHVTKTISPTKFIVFSITTVNYCCNAFEKCHNDDEITKEDAQHDYFSVSFHHGGYDEGWGNDYRIDYCPFCGAKITFVVDKVLQQVKRCKTVTEVIPAQTKTREICEIEAVDITDMEKLTK